MAIRTPLQALHRSVAWLRSVARFGCILRNLRNGKSHHERLFVGTYTPGKEVAGTRRFGSLGVSGPGHPAAEAQISSPDSKIPENPKCTDEDVATKIGVLCRQHSLTETKASQVCSLYRISAFDVHLAAESGDVGPGATSHHNPDEFFLRKQFQGRSSYQADVALHSEL